MVSPNDIMNGKPVLPTAPKLQIRKSIRMQAIVDWINEMFCGKKIKQKQITSIPWPEWQPYNKDLIPNNVSLVLKSDNGGIIKYYIDKSGKYWLLSTRGEVVYLMDGKPIKMLIIPYEQ